MDVMLTRTTSFRDANRTTRPLTPARAQIAHATDRSLLICSRSLRRSRPGCRRLYWLSADARLFFPELADDRFERFDDLVLRGATLRKTQFQIERFGGRTIREDVMLRAAGLRLRRCLAQLLPRGSALAGDLLDERRHFLRRLLFYQLREPRLGGNVGQPTKVADFLGHCLQRQRLGDRGARFSEAPGKVLVRVAAAIGEAVQRLRLLERRQVLALQILDERQLDHFRVVDVAY